jgi:GxxExxY protein
MPFEDEHSPFSVLAQPSDESNSLAHRVIGIAIAVHRELGPGLPEIAYENALAIEFQEHGICFRRQHRLVVEYKGQAVASVRVDFLIEEMLVLEVKSVETLHPIDRKQVVRYLKIPNLPLGLLINFNLMILKQRIHRVFRAEPVPE